MYILKKNCYNNKYSVFIITNNLLFIKKIIWNYKKYKKHINYNQQQWLLQL